MKKTLVLGIGSRLLMDDGIGIFLVEDLQQFFSSYNNIEFIPGETDVYYCLAKISKADFVIVIDAFLSGKNPGEITVIPFNNLKQKNSFCLSLHGIHLLELIHVMKDETSGILIGIEPYEINYGFSLSYRLKSCYDQICKLVCKLLEQAIKSQNC